MIGIIIHFTILSLCRDLEALLSRRRLKPWSLASTRSPWLEGNATWLWKGSGITSSSLTSKFSVSNYAIKTQINLKPWNQYLVVGLCYWVCVSYVMAFGSSFFIPSYVLCFFFRFLFLHSFVFLKLICGRFTFCGLEHLCVQCHIKERL